MADMGWDSSAFGRLFSWTQICRQLVPKHDWLPRISNFRITVRSMRRLKHIVRKWISADVTCTSTGGPWECW
jgi:hypothetical protein